MGRWWNSDRAATFGLVCKGSLAAGSVAAMLLLAACGDKEDEQASGSGNATETAAPAAAIDPAQAPIIQKAIEDYLQVAEGPAEQRILHHGAVKVTAGSDAFDVSIEGVRVGPDGEGNLDVGTIGYRLTPKGTDGYIASNLTHAGSMPFKEKDGKESGALTFTTKAFSGEWSSSLQTFLALDWQAADLVAKDNAPDGGNFSAKGLTAKIASTDKGSGLFDQTGAFELTDFVGKDTTGGSFTLAKLDLSGLMTAIKLKEYVAKTREMQTLMGEIADATAKAEAAAAAASASGNTTPTEPTAEPATGISDAQAAKLGTLIKDMSGLIGGVKYDVAFSEAGFKNKDGSEPFHLGQGAFNIAFDGLDKEKAAVNLGLSHDKLVINDPDLAGDPLFAKLLPASGKLDLNLTEVPSKELWQLVGDNFPNLVTADPARSDAAAGVMFIALQQLLQKAPMKLAVAPSGLTSEVMKLDATGNFDVKPEATLGVIGALDIALYGLDEAMKLANEAAQSSPNAAQIVGGLAMIQSMAKREAGSDGKPVDKLKLEVDAAGDAKVNGMSLSGM
ncbi:hypothetical protein [Dongia sp.]|uniref:hypothetical protein n=1 Tax=Dongia sp. TaxID=1977262 RepID=UPI0035ADCE71